MKLFKKLFSRFFVIALILLVEAAAIIFLLVYANQHTYIVTIISNTLAILLVILVMNRDEPPEMKIPWVFILTLFPIGGVIIYILFGNHSLRKREKKYLKNAHEAITQYHIPTLEQIRRYDQEVLPVTNLFSYLQSVTGSPGYFDNNVTYYKNGETFFEALKNELNKAEKFIFMEYFIIGKGRLWDEIHEILARKAKEGVEVRLLYDDVGSNPYIPFHYFKKLRKEGIQAYLFNPFRPIVSGVYNNRDHRKICVVDHRCAFTGGHNIRDEYANYTHPFGYWKDVALKIEGSSIKEFIIYFLEMFDMTSRTTSDFHKYLDFPYPESSTHNFLIPFVDGPKPFYPEFAGEKNFINLLGTAKKSVYISTPYLICSHSLIEAIKSAALRGVDVHLFLPGIPDKKIVYWMSLSNVPKLLKAGVKVHIYTQGFNHAKSVLVDDKLTFVGTINFDYRSLVHHFEDGVTIMDDEVAKDVKNDFLEMETQSRLLDEKTFKISAVSRVFCVIFKLFAPLL